MKPFLPTLLSVALTATCLPSAGAQPPPTPGRIVITGSNEALPPARKTDLSDDPSASPSSVSVRTAEDFRRETITSYGDPLRPVAGVSVSNYDQGVSYLPYRLLDRLVNIERVEVLKDPSAVLYTGATGALLGAASTWFPSHRCSIRSPGSASAAAPSARPNHSLM